MANYGLNKANKFTEQITLGLNANSTSSVTAALDISENLDIVWSVLEKTGSHSNHVFTFQRSTDKVNWKSTGSTVTAGTTYVIKTNLSDPVRYIRIKCTTAEGSASTVDIIIDAK